MTSLPMFPLGSVLLPGSVLPLNIFEPRYRQLVRDCVEAPEHEFGVVLIERGSEVGGGDVRRDVGTIARMVQVAELPDGRYAVIAVGTARMRVVSWLPDDPYPLADVEELPDVLTDADAESLWPVIDGLLGRVRSAAALALELGDPATDPTSITRDALGEDLVHASYRIVSAAPVGSDDQYRLLAASGPAERLTLLAEMLESLEAVLSFRLADAGEQAGDDLGGG